MTYTEVAGIIVSADGSYSSIQCGSNMLSGKDSKHCFMHVDDRKVTNIQAGQVVCFSYEGTAFAFQTKEDIALTGMTVFSDITVEPGSLFDLEKREPSFMFGKVLFENIRMPTKNELLIYNRLKTV